MFSDVRDLLDTWQLIAKRTGTLPDFEHFDSHVAGDFGTNLMVLREENADYFYEHVGQEVASLFGHDPAGKFLSALPHRGAQAYKQHYRRCIASGVPAFSVQRKVVFGIPGSSERLLLPVRLSNGRDGLIVYARSRADNHDLVKAVFNASQHGVLAVSAVRDDSGEPVDLQILAVNSAGAALVGSEPDQLIGTNLKSLLPPAGWVALWPGLSASLETGETRSFEAGGANSGFPGTYRFSSARVGDGLAITISDLTQLHYAMQTLETQHSTLVKVNAELRSEVVRRSRLEAELKRLAATDPLTGIDNRRGFTESMTAWFKDTRKGAPRSGQDQSALIMFDLDDFKSINDRYGHPVGDTVLQNITEVVSSRLGDGDLFGRIGGEEFAVFLPGATIGRARESAEEFRQAIADAEFGLPEASYGVTASFGVVSADPRARSNMEPEQISVDQLVSLADGALYSAKRNGRNRVVCDSKSTFTPRTRSA